MTKNKEVPVRFRNSFKWIASQVYIVLFMIIGRLSLKYAYDLGKFFGVLFYYASKERKEIVEENVQILKAWGAKRNLKNPLLDKENSVIAKEIYKSNMGNFLYSIALMNKPMTVIGEHLEIENIEVLEKAYKQNKGVILLFYHLGPWELSPILPELMPFLKEKAEFSIMYRPLNNYYFNKWYTKKRSSFGAKLLCRDDGFIKVIRNVKKGSILCLANDIRMREGEKIELFDSEASTSTIPSVLHKLAGSPLLAYTLVKSGDLHWKFQFKEIVLPASGECSEKELLLASNEHLEKIIHKYPYDYFFFQNRFK